jgi:hypothetical protein
MRKRFDIRIKWLEELMPGKTYDLGLLDKYLTLEEQELIERAELVIEAARSGEGTDHRPDDPPDRTRSGWLRFVSETDLELLEQAGSILDRAELQYKAEAL